MFLGSSGVVASGKWDFNKQYQDVYKDLIALKTPKAEKNLRQLALRDPDNLVILFLQNYLDFLEIFMNEDPAVYEKKWPEFLKRLNQLKSIPENLPFHDFAPAIGEFQAAAIQIKFNNNWDAGWRFRSSFLHMKQAAARFPEFQPARFYSNAMQAVAGTIPAGYKWLAFMLGVSGNLEKGLAGASQIFTSNDDWSNLFQQEACFLFAYMQFHVANHKEEAVNFILSHCKDLSNQHLLCYLAANLSNNNQHPTAALGFIRSRNLSSDYLDLPLWNLESGIALLAKAPAESKLEYKSFLANFKGSFYVKGALIRLAWLNYLEGNATEAAYYKAQVLTKGGLYTEADRQAMKEASQKNWPNKILLKCRLLSDGGMYSEALQLLVGKRTLDFESEGDQLEFLYRTARINDELNKKETAITFYQYAYNRGKGRKEYFAARSALQLGMIYEDAANKPLAISWYLKCLELGEHDFKNSLDQKAKAGLLRCGYN